MIILILVLAGTPTEQHRFLSRKEAIASLGMREEQARGMSFHVSTQVTSLGWPSPWLCIIEGKVWQFRRAGIVEVVLLLAGAVCIETYIRIGHRQGRG